MNDLSSYSDEELMLEIKADNMLAFDVIYNKYVKRLFKFTISILKSKEETENIIQEVFINFWMNRSRIEKGSSIKYYIFTIAYNSAMTLIRKKAREIKFIDYLKTLQVPFQDPVDEQVEYKELDTKLEMIIKELPERQKEVFLLHGVEGLKYTEIAAKLNISINTIETHMARALKTIRAKLGKYPVFLAIFCHLIK